MQTDNNYDELPETPTLGQQIKRWLGIMLLLGLTIFVVLGLYAVWTAWKLWTNCSVSEPFSVSENAPSASAPPSFWTPQQGTGNNAGGQEIHGSLFPNQPEQPTHAQPSAESGSPAETGGQLAAAPAGTPPAESSTDNGKAAQASASSPTQSADSAAEAEGTLQASASIAAPASSPKAKAEKTEPAAGTPPKAAQQPQKQTPPAPVQKDAAKNKTPLEAATAPSKRDAKPQAAKQKAEVQQPTAKAAAQKPAPAKQDTGAKPAETAPKATTSASAGISTRLNAGADSVIFIISGPPPLKGQSSKFGNRVILDIQGAWRIAPAQPNSTAFLKKIRTAVQPSGTTRLVFDLTKEPSSWRLIQSNPGTLEVRIAK